MKPEVISEEPLAMAEVKNLLKKVEKRDEELTFRSAKTVEYLKELTLLSETKAKELAKKIMDLGIPRLKEEHVAKIIDLMPYTKDDIKLVLSGYTLTIKNENVKKIHDVLTEYRK